MNQERDLKISSSESNQTITHLYFEIPGHNDRTIKIEVWETEINSGKFNLIVESNWKYKTFVYELEERHDEENITYSVLDGILTISIPLKKPKYFTVKLK